MGTLEVRGRRIEVDEEGYLLDPEQWDEEVARTLAEGEGIRLGREGCDADHARWELVCFFREFYEEHMRHPTMHELVRIKGAWLGDDFEEQKRYERYVYSLFPEAPVAVLCKLAGLPKPEEDLEE